MMDIPAELTGLLAQTVKPLLAWYDRSARVLPWRENTDPYRIWVSEIMLQQTRVDTVIPYYNRFLRELPTPGNLAGANEETLFKLWEGLGYYSRIKNMQKAARVIRDEFGGIFPSRYEDIVRLPGIGPYTAGAISSIAFSLPVPAVDGNVLRVVTRLAAWEADISDPAVKRAVTESLRQIYPAERCGDYTQSLMELGAVVCIPNGFPKCAECPLGSLCIARAAGKQTSFPVLPEKKPRKNQDLTVFLLQSDGLTAIRKRPPGGLLGGMWEFPNVEGRLSAGQAEEWLKEQGIAARSFCELPPKKHIFTHIEWRMTCFSVQCVRMNNPFIWVDEQALERDVALPTAFKKLLPR